MDLPGSWRRGSGNWQRCNYETNPSLSGLELDLMQFGVEAAIL